MKMNKIPMIAVETTFKYVLNVETGLTRQQ